MISPLVYSTGADTARMRSPVWGLGPEKTAMAFFSMASAMSLVPGGPPAHTPKLEATTPPSGPMNCISIRFLSSKVCVSITQD